MDQLACLLIDNAKKIKQTLTQSLSGFEITCRQSLVLRSLENTPLSAKKISEVCSIDKATLSAILSKLTEHNFVECQANENDKRENIYFLSIKGEKMLPDMMTAEDGKIERIFKNLTEKEYETLVLLLSKLNI